MPVVQPRFPAVRARRALTPTARRSPLSSTSTYPSSTGDQVRALLAPVIDFKALTPAEAYEKTLPPKVQEAIKDHKILVGMDKEMVTYRQGPPAAANSRQGRTGSGLRRMDLRQASGGSGLRSLQGQRGRAARRS